ncbi:MAG: molybdopterin biosynthesis protein [Clostridiales bacterium]|nr:molybdopterin biosynthesis protein [Clostridiales bacterium]
MIMKHNYLNNLPLDEAKRIYKEHLASVGFGGGTETVKVTDACGRTIKNAAYAVICSPHYNASAMDGVAVRAEITFPASEKTPVMLTPDDYAVVDTGDPIPDGCDAVIMIEDLIDRGNGDYGIIASHRPWQNVRQVGEDICMGDMIAPSGTVLTPSLCGALLAGGITEIEVYKRPLAGVIPTGDEIVAPTSDPKKGDIIEFNSTVFKGMLDSFGADAKVYPITPDKKELIRSAVEKALEECDIVLVSAGSSAGRDDYTGEIISSLGTVLVHGIAIKPGKPAVLGEAKGKPVIGLPGYPVSAIVVMDEIVSEVCAAYYSGPSPKRETVKAVLAKKVVSSLKYGEYVRVSLGRINGRLIASPLARGAGVITSFTKSDGVLAVPQNSEGIEAGAQVNIRLHKPLCEIEDTLVITGSHDPLIDEVADFLAKKSAPFRVCSTHVGSMGAIYAIKGGLAHMGGIHLLDTETGEYNKSYVEKYLPDGGGVTVRGVGRVQGLMVRGGNPLGIRDFSDVKNARYVNRQRGAGTRILCDYLIKKNGMKPEEINGYANEEFTHTAVAALIAAGNADAGLGIYSAAKMYGLDFIPICNETYEFLVAENELENPAVKAFLDVLYSDEFKKRLGEMGGYTE